MLKIANMVLNLCEAGYFNGYVKLLRKINRDFSPEIELTLGEKSSDITNYATKLIKM